MATTFVILAAGRGTRMGRVGDHLHKCLVPIDGRAIIARQLELLPTDARVVIVTGDRSEQVETYLQLAHPSRTFTFTYAPGGGPGRALLAALDRTPENDALVYMSCDTLWERDDTLWQGSQSWVGLAPVPAGTPPARWCRMTLDGRGNVNGILDKQHTAAEWAAVFVGLARIAASDLPDFRRALQEATPRGGELRDPEGFLPLVAAGALGTRHVNWIDVGDEPGYHRAVLRLAGYDWTKPDEATYVLPAEGRVVKYWADAGTCARRAYRSRVLGSAAPRLLETTDHMLAYRFAPGVTLYDLGGDFVPDLLDWATQRLWRPVTSFTKARRRGCHVFYRDKTLARIEALPDVLRLQCQDVVARVDWDRLVDGYEPVTPWHGDFNFGNVLATDGEEPFQVIDWREDFAGFTAWGDRRYDIGKLLAGCYVHWDNARRGDLRPWPLGVRHAKAVRDWLGKPRPDIEIIGALSLLNCAALHAPPLDEVLVARGAAWLEEAVG